MLEQRRLDTSSEHPEIDLIESTNCHALFEQVLESYYVPLEVWYLRSVIDKVRPPGKTISQTPSDTRSGASGLKSGRF